MNSNIFLNTNFAEYIPISEQGKTFGCSVIKLSNKGFQSFEIENNNIKSETNNSLISNRWYVPIIDEYFHFYYVHEGEAFIKSFDYQGIIKKGTFILFQPNDKFEISPNLNKDYNEFQIIFNGEIPNRWVQNTKLFQTSYPISVDSDTVVKDFNKLVKISKATENNIQPLLASTLISNLTRYFFLSETSLYETTLGEDPFLKIKNYFTENLYKQFNIQDICDSMNMNYYQLRNYFLNITGMSPYQYLLDMKINKAKELLETTNYQIKEISYKLAFDSQYYFSRLFKKKTGYTPSQWKNKTKKYKNIGE